MCWWGILRFIIVFYSLQTTRCDHWPAGTYGLPKAASGCPSSYGFRWKTGWRLQDTNGTIRSDEFHLDGEVDYKKVNRSFCIKRNTSNQLENSRPLWPLGEYCVYKRGSQCPSGLREGYVFWDDDDFDNSNKKSGILPSGQYDKDTKIKFCCQTNGNKKEPILLPTELPFFLLAYGSGECQMVKWAIATLEWIYYDTEDLNNKDFRTWPYPYDAGIDHPTIYYCYYRGCNKTISGVKGTFHSPNYPNEYPDGQYCSWRITVSPGQRIHLAFTAFSLQSENNTDALYVFDAQNDTGELLGVFYGEHPPPVNGINSSSNHMFIIFKSDETDSSYHTGFNATYIAVYKSDYDECIEPELNKCHAKAKCTNTEGSYNCTCIVGYVGDGFLCQDYDECIKPELNKCHEKAKCTNTEGSYNCTCIDGYVGDGFLCQDYDDCKDPELNKCNEKAKCTNTEGSYNCTCIDGYVGGGFYCQDYDECIEPELNKCHEKAKCTNTEGSYNCTCIDGYVGGGFYCQDYDECIEPELNKCNEKAKCTNTEGSYNCTCIDGYVGDGFLCQDYDECKDPEPNKCHEKAKCTNTEGSHNCTCIDGYVGNGFYCQDYDECKDPELNKCQEKAKCTNTEGSYNCTCIDGYVGVGFYCQAPPSITYTDPPLESSAKENVTLTCHASGLPEPTFTWITPDPDGTLVNATAPVRKVVETLDDGSEVFTGKELQEDGSLLVYNTLVEDQGVYKCVATNDLGKAVGNVSLNVREDIVEVSAAVTLEEEVFDEELKNKTSPRYQEMERNVKQELTLLFQDIKGFQRVDILGFYNGSVKVRFRVVVKVDKQEEKPAEVVSKVGETLRDNVENGQIGNLKVKKTLEMEEVPPPPVNLQYSDVMQTEARITWSHPELYEEYAISSYSLQFKKFGTKTWTQFANTRGDNHRLTNLEQGTPYIVRLKSVNKFGRGDPSESLELQTEKEKKTSGSEIALAIVLPILFLILLAIAGVFVYRRWKKKQLGKTPEQGVPLHPLVPESPNQTDAGGTITFGTNVRYESIPGTDPNGASAVMKGASFSWREIPRDRLILGKVLGEGEFGMVVKGELTEDDGRTILCAVKKLKRVATESDFKDLLNELEIMTSVGNHPNLINLIGACSKGGPLMILVEFAEKGSLLKYLRDHRQQNYDDMNQYSLDISSSQRLRIACDVANGMSHLAAIKCAHRDLAARNVLLGEGLVAKVSDFGLSRDIYTDDVYEKKTGGKLPAKWMAVESLEQGVYTSQSDVWSYGVLLWEIETGGCAPYAGMVASELLSKIKAGSRLEKLRYSSDWMYTVMLRCWDANPKKRPTFEELSDELDRMYKQETDYLAPIEFRLEPDYVSTSVENVSSA